MFTEAQRQSVRALRYNLHVPCAHCGKKRRLHWTMLCAFRSIIFEECYLVVDSKRDGKPFPPLTPVCGDHLLTPDWPKKPKTKTKR